ncbi:DAPG hydrolase family protein [Nocardia miyunensis]|uniref:DAPG hydrolase family protein n=1 Tax=Nocardia miyunensis TaxID=282684 RepID=UPI000829A75F|nr:hypothetical protein [Nocardia miyunensis]
MRSVRLSRRAALRWGGALTGALATGPWTRTSARADQPLCPPRYPGYSAQDWAKPFSRFMTGHTLPAPDPVRAACAGPPVPAARIPGFADLTRDLAPTGYFPTETGYGQTATGISWVACRTEMPRVTARMWDWWFGWHSNDSARYKLWHPDAHMYASIAVDKTAAPVPDRSRYVGNTSYVDEYIGPKLQQLAIRFDDPVQHGFTVPDGHTVVFGRVGSSVAPVDLGRLAHQVRPVPGGVEMRSRFYLNLYGLHMPDARQALCATERGASVDPRDVVLGMDVARNLLMHCGQEMYHLSRFLPELYAAFGR